MQTAQNGPRMAPAPLSLRLLASALDVLALWAWQLVLAALLLTLLPAERVPAALAAAGGVSALAYMAVAWGVWGTSLGKAACGLRVVAYGGGRMTLRRGVARVAAYLLASLPAKLGLLAAIWDPERRGWHDRLAGTMVVRAGKARRPARPGAERPAPAELPAGARRRWAAAALAAYAALAVALTWPLAALLGTHIPGGEMLGLSEDSYVFLWDYWWVGKALGEHLPVMFTNYIFWPHGVSLRFHTLMPQNGLLAVYPQQWLGLVPTYNLLLLASLVGSAWAGYGLAMMVVRRPGPALVAGGVFAFSPYMMTHALSHMNLIALQWMPVLAWLLVKGMGSGRPAWGVGAGVALGLLAYCDWYGFMFGGLLAALIGGCYLATRGRRLAAAATLALAAAVGLAVAAPLLWPMLAEQRAHPYAVTPLSRSAALSGDPALWLTPPFLSTMAGGVGGRLVRGMGYLVSEQTVYLGWGVLALAVVGWRRRRRELAPWLVGAVGLLVLSLGPYLRVAGREYAPAGLVLLAGGLPGNGFDLPTGSGLARRLALALVASGPAVLAAGERIWLPYEWLYHWVPVLKAASVPVRMAQPALLYLAVMAAAGLGALWQQGGRARGVGLALAGLVAVEFLPFPYPLRELAVSPFYRQLARERVTAICETPLTADLGAFQFYQTVHQKRLLAGHVSRLPGEAFRVVRSNRLLSDLMLRQPMLPGSDRYALTGRAGRLGVEETRRLYQPGLESLRRLRVAYLVVHPGVVSAADAAAVDLVMHRLGVSAAYRDGAVVAYRLLAQEPRR